MQRHPIGPSPKFPLIDKQWVLATSVMLALAVATSANAQTSQVDIVGLSSALSTVAQRHVVRIQPAGHSPVLLMAVQNDGWSFQHFGLLWYRSNDDGATWFYYKDVIAQPDLAVFDQTKSPQTLHLTADLIVVGNDIAAVFSYDTTQSGFPADAWDSKRVVYFQWWRYDGVNDWNPGTRLTVASVTGTQAYHRAEIARDSLGRLWVQAFLRQDTCPNPGVTCTGDILRVWVSTDGGATFQGPQDLATLTNQLGGGRLISLGSKLMMLWGDYSSNPAQMRMRSDSDPVTTWSIATNAFPAPDSSQIYHGAALSAAADGAGGLHLVYKEWVGPTDEQQLYYRYYNGTVFGAKQAVDTVGDWALQPAVTTVGNDVYVCLNHMITTNLNHEMRLYKRSAGWATYQSIDTLILAKAYPNALESAPPTPAFLPCAFGTGDPSTWGDQHTVKVAREPIPADFALAANPNTITVAQGSSGSSSISVTPTGGFNSSITLSASGVPAGSTLAFSPNPVAPGSSSTATFSSGSAAPNNYSVSVIGSGGTLNRSTPLACIINPPVSGCAPLTSCSGQCVDTTSDVNNCGGCGIVCSGTPNGFPVCSASSCTIGCNGGYHTCGDGRCISNSQLCP